MTQISPTADAGSLEIADETVDPSQQIVPGLIAVRRMNVFGRVLMPGDPITLDIYNLRRFEAIKRSGYVKEVPV